MLIASGITTIAGVDEAGRGPCAGPLLVAAVILENPFADTWSEIRDSKELSEAKREKLFDVIMQEALAVNVVEIPPAEIDARGVHAANLDGMRRAVQGLNVIPEYVLTDGYAIEGLSVPNVAVWKGDQVSVAIGAASIIAKVTRDRIMVELDKEFPEYGFAGHKGYITALHTAALRDFGVTRVHRTSFSNIAELL